MYGRDPWGCPFEVDAADPIHRLTLPRSLDAVERSWLLRPAVRKKTKKVNLGCVQLSRKVFLCTLATFLLTSFLAGAITIIVKHVPNHETVKRQRDIYCVALNTTLIFFSAQKSGKLPDNNNVSWRGNSCLKDMDVVENPHRDVVGGYYDAGDTTKFSFPMSYAMTMLSWSVIEYSAKYEAAGELDHVKELIKWGTDYFLKTFNSSADTVDRMVSQVGYEDKRGGSVMQNDHYCWIRPEDVDYKRSAQICYSGCSDLAAEMAAALASASIVFRGNRDYSKKLVHGAKTLYKFANFIQESYSIPKKESSEFYKSSQFWDELLWGGAWMYYATGNVTYLDQVTDHDMAMRAGAFSGGPNYGVPSWDNKLPGAQLLLTRLRLFLSPGYPYEDLLRTFHNQTGIIMCSYLPYFKKFKRTKGGLVMLNHGDPRPLQYAANAAFLATLFSDYLEASDTPGWYCGPHFYSTDVLRDFAKSQIDYILGKNPRRMSYLVGFGHRYPKHVHHRGASIPKSVKKVSCEGGWKWRDTKKKNPNTIVGAMVAGPDKHDGFHAVAELPL